MGGAFSNTVHASGTASQYMHQALSFPTAAGARSVGGSIRARETCRLFQAAAATLAGWEADVAGCSLLFRSGSGDAVVGVIGTACFGQLEHATELGCRTSLHFSCI